MGEENRRNPREKDMKRRKLKRKIEKIGRMKKNKKIDQNYVKKLRKKSFLVEFRLIFNYFLGN